MKLLVAISVVVGILAANQLVASAPTDEIDCSKIEAVIDEHGPAQGFTSGSAKHPLPETEAQYGTKCQEMKDSITLLKRYNNKCYSALTQQVFSSILRSRAGFNDIYCKAGSPERTEGLEATKCIKENSLDQLKVAEKKFTVYAQALHEAKIPDEKLRIRNTCCSVVSGTKNFMDAFNEKCGKHSTLFAQYMDSYKSEAMSLICPADDKLECDKLEKLNYEGVEAKNDFFLNPLLKLVKSVDH